MTTTWTKRLILVLGLALSASAWSCVPMDGTGDGGGDGSGMNGGDGSGDGSGGGDGSGDGGGDGVTGDATSGMALVTDNCAGCHGDDGASGFAPNIQGATAAIITEFIMMDGHPNPELSEQDIADIEAYLGTFGDDAGTDDTLLKVFMDPDSDFETTDVFDVDGDIVQHDDLNGELIWKADGTREAGWPSQENFLGTTGAFLVRFGTVDGERRAFFTETGPATICDIRLNNGNIQIFPTNVTVPQE